MGNLLSSLPKTIHASLALALILFLGLFLVVMVVSILTQFFGVG